MGNEPDRSTGFEVNPSRVLKEFTCWNVGAGAKLHIEGGNLTAGDLHLTQGEIATGPYKIVHTGGGILGTGRFSGEVEKRLTFAPVNHIWYFVSGQIFVSFESLGPSPVALSIRSIPGPMPGLLPGASLSRHWQIQKTGNMTTQLSFSYVNAEIRGNESNYELWRGNGGTP